MNTYTHPPADHFYVDNTFGAIDGIPDPDAVLTTAWTAVWQTLAPIGACGFNVWEATLVLASDADVRRLNKQYRGKDKPTNVLSFPDGEAEPDATAYPLGDIIIAVPTLMAEARDKNTPPAHHLAHLTVHGLLHLCGYDHHDDAEADVMEQTEALILAKMGIPNPYDNDQPLES
jgi:probable rRNA maturation factor